MAEIFFFIIRNIYLVFILISGSTNTWNFLSVERFKGVFCYVNEVSSGPHLSMGAAGTLASPPDFRGGERG